MAKIIIVGSGISGLALAYRLKQAVPAASILVLEKQSRIGGKIWTEHQDGFVVECGPNGFLDQKTSTLDLCHELGMADQLISASDDSRKNRYLFRGLSPDSGLEQSAQ